MEIKQITVFGATGKIGSELIRLLSQAKIPTVAVTRNISKAIELPFVKWMQADIANKQSLYPTMQKTGAVFLLSGHSPDFVTEQTNVISVAKESKINYIVKLSSGAADQHSRFYIPKTHGQVEDFLITSGIHYAMLRPNGIMQNWLGDIAESVKKDRKFYEATGYGKRAHVDRRDIAEVAFTCLTNAGKHLDKIYLLTSDKAVNYFEIADAIGNALNEKVEYVPVSSDEVKAEMLYKGMPLELIETFIAYDEAQADGKTATVTDCVKTILGKPARTLENFMKDYTANFK